MSRDQIRAKIRDVLAGILDDDSLAITDQTTAGDVSWWDSLNHLKLLVTLENDMGIKFTTVELISAQNVGELVDLVASKV
jgi:acyl carrier protein